MSFAQAEIITKEFGQYGPVWLLVACLLMGFAILGWSVISGITWGLNLLFDNTIDAITQKPKGLLVPFIQEHLGVFRRTEFLVESMTDATQAMAANNERDSKHAERLELLMQLIEQRLKALDETNNERVHKALLALSDLMLDNLRCYGADATLIEKHRSKIASILTLA